jgi:hypothetical protein
MHIAIVCKLLYVLAIDLQLLAAYCVFRSAICTNRFRCLYAARTERVEKAVLAFERVRCEGRGWPGVFFLEIVPLLPSTLFM